VARSKKTQQHGILFKKGNLQTPLLLLGCSMVFVAVLFSLRPMVLKWRLKPTIRFEKILNEDGTGVDGESTGGAYTGSGSQNKS
jgi:hypothetical protein